MHVSLTCTANPSYGPYLRVVQLFPRGSRGLNLLSFCSQQVKDAGGLLRTLDILANGKRHNPVFLGFLPVGYVFCQENDCWSFGCGLSTDGRTAELDMLRIPSCCFADAYMAYVRPEHEGTCTLRTSIVPIVWRFVLLPYDSCLTMAELKVGRMSNEKGTHEWYLL